MCVFLLIFGGTPLPPKYNCTGASFPRVPPPLHPCTFANATNNHLLKFSHYFVSSTFAGWHHRMLLSHYRIMMIPIQYAITSGVSSAMCYGHEIQTTTPLVSAFVRETRKFLPFCSYLSLLSSLTVQNYLVTAVEELASM